MIVKRGRTKHWILLVKNNRTKNFQVLDSLWELSTYRHQIDKMVRYYNRSLNTVIFVHDLCSIMCNRPNWELIEIQIMGINAILGVSTPKANVLSWDVIQEGDIPQQKDGYVLPLPTKGLIYVTNQFMYFSCRCSCGLYVLKFIEFWNGFYLPENFGEVSTYNNIMSADFAIWCTKKINAFVYFTQSDVHTFRLRVLVELLLAELNDIADVKEEILSLSQEWSCLSYDIEFLSRPK